MNSIILKKYDKIVRRKKNVKKAGQRISRKKSILTGTLM